MNGLLQTVDELRRMSQAELTQLGEDSLLERIKNQAIEARARNGPLSAGNLNAFLSDPDSVRHPTRLVLEFGEMGLHQFAQPEPDHRQPGGRVLYLRPILGQRPDLIALAVSYMIPIINYGGIITDAHCLAYGARLMGMDEDTYYTRICELADFTGARGMSEDDPNSHVPASDPNRGDDHSDSCGCGTGGGCSSVRTSPLPLPFLPGELYNLPRVYLK